MALGDNTLAIAWIYKSSRVKKSSNYYPAVKYISRTLALRSIESNAKICSQHVAGKRNAVADVLSFSGSVRGQTNALTHDNPPNDILTSRFHRYYSQVIPIGFQILPLPEEIESFAYSVLQIMLKSWSREGKRQTRRQTDSGDVGEDSWRIGGSGATVSLMKYPEIAKDSYWQEGLSSQSDIPTSISRAELLADVRDQWYQRLFAMPLAAWHRCLGNVEGPAPSTSRTESMAQDRSTPD